MNAFALRALHAQLYTEALPRYLPTDPTLHPHAVRVANKSGCLPGLWHDAGIVFARRPYALVVMTSGSRDRSESWEQEGTMAIARLSKAVFDLMQA